MSNASEEYVSSDDGRRRRAGVRIFWYVVAAFIVVAVIVVIDRTIGNQLRCVRAADAILKNIDLLVLRTPPDLTQEEWDVAVFWTHNLHGNSFLAFQTPLVEIRRFQDELESRIQGDVDMSTIDWIWERYAMLTQSGKNYQHYRDVMREEMKRGDTYDDYKRFRVSVQTRYQH